MRDAAVRPARSADLPAVAELRWRWVADKHGTPTLPVGEFVSRFVDWARRNEASHHCFVAELGGSVVGMVWLAVTPRVPHPHAVERASADLQCMYVLPGYRDRGLGGRLIEAVMEAARELGAEPISVHSSERALSAYSRHGFAVSPRLLQAVPETQAAPGARGIEADQPPS